MQHSKSIKAGKDYSKLEKTIAILITNEKIEKFEELKYHTEFPQRKKADVNGDTAIAFANGMRPFLNCGSGCSMEYIIEVLPLRFRNFK